jgi:DNA-directed RNA polymerase subunit M/transcription elongation factor TFIIS
MKVSCPNCKKVLQAPDKWSGRKVKCPACRQPISLPRNVPAGADADAGFDFGSLESIENAGEAVVFERRAKPMTLAEAQAAAAVTSDEQNNGAKADPCIRTCPKCGQKVRSDDLYCEIICRHCGGGIPGLEIQSKEKPRYTSAMAGRMVAPVTFYSGFTTAATYPIPAMAAILLGVGVALAAIMLPMLAVLGFTAGAGLNPISEATDFSWVGIFLTVMFVAEAVYFGSVGYYIMIDTIRTTTAGSEQPPNLTWNIINLGAALGGYAALIGFYVVVVLLLMGGIPTHSSDFEKLASPLSLIVLALLTFGVPMNIIGLSSSHALDGLNPVRVLRSIGRLVGHYIFLYLIVLIYLGLYAGLMWGVMSWAGPLIMSAAREGLGAGFVNMLLGVGAWAVVMGLGFYFAYSIGRVIGLFSRTYREQIDFEL